MKAKKSMIIPVLMIIIGSFMVASSSTAGLLMVEDKIDTLEPTNVTSTSASLRGMVLGETIMDKVKFKITGGETNYMTNVVSDFSQEINNLQPDTQYRYYAYAKIDGEEYFGGFVSFTTESGSPQPPTHSLVVDEDGRGAVVIEPDNGYYVENTEVTLTANAEENCHFDNWVTQDDEVRTENPTTIIMDSNKAVQANFSSSYDVEDTEGETDYQMIGGLILVVLGIFLFIPTLLGELSIEEALYRRSGF